MYILFYVFYSRNQKRKINHNRDNDNNSWAIVLEGPGQVLWPGSTHLVVHLPHAIAVIITPFKFISEYMEILVSSSLSLFDFLT